MLDRRHVHGEESSVVFSRFIGMELDSEGSVMSTDLNIKNLKILYHSSASDIIFLYQLAQSRPNNVLHFLVLHMHVCVIAEQ